MLASISVRACALPADLNITVCRSLEAEMVEVHDGKLELISNTAFGVWREAEASTGLICSGNLFK